MEAWLHENHYLETSENLSFQKYEGNGHNCWSVHGPSNSMVATLRDGTA